MENILNKTMLYANSNGDSNVYSHIDNIDMNYQSWSNKKDLIIKYRSAAKLPEMQFALEEIRNSALVFQDFEKPFEFKIKNNSDFNKTENKELETLFNNFYNDNIPLIQETNKFFDKFYIEGRLFIEKIYNEKNELIKYAILDPIKLELKKDNNGVLYYEYTGTTKKIKIENVISINSGLYLNGEIISNIHQALKPLYQLTQLKDHLLIYRMVRAPERLIFYIDTGKLTNSQAKETIADLKDEYNFKLNYNRDTGEIDLKQAKYAMTDNIWLSRSDGKSTEISSIGGDVNLGSIEDYKIYHQELYRHLHIPQQKLDFIEGGRIVNTSDAELNSQENNFMKFVNNVRFHFAPLFIELFVDYIRNSNKNFTDEKIEKIKKSIYVNFYNTADFNLKFKFANLRAKIDMVNELRDYIGKPDSNRDDALPLFSMEMIWKEIMGYTDAEIEKLKDQINKEYEEGFAFYVEKDMM